MVLQLGRSVKLSASDTCLARSDNNSSPPSSFVAHIWPSGWAIKSPSALAFLHQQDHFIAAVVAIGIGSTNKASRNHNAMQERRRRSSTPMGVTVSVAVTTTLCYLSAAALLLAAPCGAQVVVTIEEACRMASSAGNGVSYAHCVASLASDARSRDAADLHQLAALAARMAVEHASATEAKMEDLGEVEESPHARARLHHCLDLYNAAADVLRDALDNLRARVYGKASQQLAAALGAAESCEDVWKGEERVPVASHDREYGRMALLALGLTSGIA